MKRLEKNLLPCMREFCLTNNKMGTQIYYDGYDKRRLKYFVCIKNMIFSPKRNDLLGVK